MTESWTMLVDRSDLARSEVRPVTTPELEQGQALLKVDRVGLTANNVTYAVLGEAYRYWEFFPSPPEFEPGWGLVPLWGFAEVAKSTVGGVAVGERVYGYLPPAGHLVVRPVRVDERGFRDAAAHRASLPSPYNAYASTTGDAAYEADRENLQVLYRPLFFTSFMLADYLEDNGYFGADALVFSSASSKTAYGAAFLLADCGRELIGSTSPGNVDFTTSLGCYDRVLPYDGWAELDAATPTGYLDFAGSSEVRESLRQHLGAALVHDAVVGVTHQEAGPIGSLAGVRPTVFFAPEQMRKRTGDWGRAGLDDRFGAAWQRFAPTVEGWVEVATHHGPEKLREVWAEVVSGRSEPRVGHVVTF